MADQLLEVEVRYNLSLTPQQFRIVSAALAGSLVDKGWVDDGRLLQKLLWEQRASQVKNLADNILKVSEKN